MSDIVEIVPGELYGLIHPYQLDGRAGSHPVHFRGWTSANCYLLLEPDRALLYNTGYSVHQDALIAQLEGLLDGRPLVLVVPRLEFVSMCNARPLADRFPVEIVHQEMKIDTRLFLNFRPEFPRGSGGLEGVLQQGLGARGVFGTTEGDLPDEVGIRVDRAGRRRLRPIESPLRLLPQPAMFDARTRTLLAGDLFCWSLRPDRDGPWLETDPAEVPDVEAIYESLCVNRYWWLPGSDTAPLIKGMRDVFAGPDVDWIAPDHGPVIGGEAVRMHVENLVTALEIAAERPSVAVESGRRPLRAAR